jgi:hypothetical protein
MLISEFISFNLGKRPQQRKRSVPSTPIANQLKRERVIRRLTKQLTQQSNLSHPTQDNIKAAIERYKTNQKRVDLEYKKQQRLTKLRQQSHSHQSKNPKEVPTDAL